MKLDMHIHHRAGHHSAEELMDRLHEAGLDGGVILSEAPDGVLGSREENQKRLENVMSFTKDHDLLFPFYWIDPTQPDAVEQVDRAVEAGVTGFKTICTHFYPNDERAIPTYHRIAEAGKPYLFHTGILYDGKNPSGDYNRPCNFEILLTIPKLRFAMAHISWPWCDESIAVFGKFGSYLASGADEDAPELFMDVTPGTPRLYRKDALSKLLDMSGALKHVTWGTDNSTQGYRAEYSKEVQERDESICREIGLGEDFLEDLYYNNAMDFLFGAKR